MNPMYETKTGEFLTIIFNKTKFIYPIFLVNL